MPFATPARNSSTRSGRIAMPRSPASQFPGGRLCSTSFRPLASSRALISAAGNGYGKRNSTSRKPARAARSKRSRNGTSLKSIVRLAANRGMSLLQQAGQLEALAALGVAAIDVLELDDLVDLGA